MYINSVEEFERILEKIFFFLNDSAKFWLPIVNALFYLTTTGESHKTLRLIKKILKSHIQSFHHQVSPLLLWRQGVSSRMAYPVLRTLGSLSEVRTELAVTS